MTEASPRLIAFLQRYLLLGLVIRLGFVGWLLSASMTHFAWVVAVHAAIVILLKFLMRRGLTDAGIFGLGLEHLSISIVLVQLFGVETLFHIHAILAAPIALQFDHYSKRRRFLLVVAPILLPLAFSLFPWTLTPSVELTTQTTRFLAFVNLSIFTAGFMAVVLYQVRALEQQTRTATRLAEQRSRMLSGLSHELKTPLAAILAKIQATLSRPREPEAYREALDLCERNARQLRNLALRMGEVMQEHRGIQTDCRLDTDPAQVLKELADTLEPLATEKGFQLEVDCDHAPLLHTDPLLVILILRNLVSNALQHAKGGTRIVLRFDSESGPSFTVEDNGPGIPDSLLPHLFEPFTRGDAARGREQGSYGLGLAIAREAAATLGMTLQARNRPEGGACFELRFLSSMLVS